MPQLEVGREAIVFVECILLRDKSVEVEFMGWVSSLAKGVTLKFVFANGDEPPHPALRKFLVDSGHKVFGHNLMDGETGVTPIPLGLQNATHHKYGVTHDFLLKYDEIRNPPLIERTRDMYVYGNFSVKSNPQQRAPLQAMLAKSRFGFVDAQLSVRENRSRMLRAKFVPSPAGLGPDCYRTWEAIYLGAIPVIAEGTIAGSISSDLPIWVVNDWGELVSASDAELDQKFAEFSMRSRDKALFPYWQTRILK